MNAFYKLPGIFAFSCVLATGYSQPGSNFENLKKKYPDQSSVIINDQENILIDVNGSSYKITEEVNKETMILKNPTNYLVTDKVFSSHFVKLLEVEAKTMFPEGNKYKIEKVEKFTEQKNSSNYIFYDEVVAKSFVYPAVQPGAITSVRYVQELSDPHMLGSFYFKWHVPCELSRLVIKVDKRARLKYKLFNAEDANIDFSIQEKGRYNIYTWTAKDIDAAEYEPDAPDVKYYYPHIAYFIENTNPSDDSQSNIGLASLFNYYNSLIKNINTNEDKNLQQEVDKIISGAVSEEEKVKRLYYWVQDNITYVAFEDGMQGFIPEPATQVYLKRYGDCKGMSSLLSNMLKLAGIKSYLTWVGTRDIPYRYTDIPSKVTDNHMIVTYYDNRNVPHFLDATNNHLVFGYPSSMIQGKQALVGMGDKYKVEEIPVIESSQNVVSDSSSFSIVNENIVGTGNFSLTGYEKNTQTFYLIDKESKEMKDHLLGLLIRGNNKFFLDTFIVRNLDNRELPLSISYRFRLNDYIKKIDNEIYVNLSLNKAYNNQIFDKQKRKIPVESNNAHIYRSTTVFNLPDGYEVLYLPQNSSATCDKFSYSVSYRIDGRQVVQNKEIRKDFLLLYPDEFESWNKVIDTLSKAYREVLILKKK